MRIFIEQNNACKCLNLLVNTVRNFCHSQEVIPRGSVSCLTGMDVSDAKTLSHRAGSAGSNRTCEVPVRKLRKGSGCLGSRQSLKGEQWLRNKHSSYQ